MSPSPKKGMSFLSDWMFKYYSNTIQKCTFGLKVLTILAPWECKWERVMIKMKTYPSSEIKFFEYPLAWQFFVVILN